METEVTKALEAAGVTFEVRKHSEPVFTCETAAAERGVRVAQIVKCMVGRSPEGQLFAMLIPGDRLLKLKKARKHAGMGIDLVSPDELAGNLGLTVGAISPVQLVEHARILMDPTVMDEEVVDISSGDPLAGIELRSQALCDLLQAEVTEIISTS
jgi:prolyl-tRNA editing enzyme YbaK/EbsC (Cys-tRNA(Pro) deacylase)